MKELNLSNLTLFDILDINAKTKLIMKSGIIKKLKKSATYVEIIATIGLNTPTDAVAPNPVINVSKIGNKMFICLTIEFIESPAVLEIDDTIPIIHNANNHAVILCTFFYHLILISI